MKGLCGPSDNQLQRKWKKLYISTDLLPCAFHLLHSRQLIGGRELMASYFYYNRIAMHIRFLLQVLHILITWDDENKGLILKYTLRKRLFVPFMDETRSLIFTDSVRNTQQVHSFPAIRTKRSLLQCNSQSLYWHTHKAQMHSVGRMSNFLTVKPGGV
jgi:hypothetical protein